MIDMMILQILSRSTPSLTVFSLRLIHLLMVLGTKILLQQVTISLQKMEISPVSITIQLSIIQANLHLEVCLTTELTEYLIMEPSMTILFSLQMIQFL